MAQSTDIHVHDSGGVTVKSSSLTIWISVPLSVDGTANIAVFISAQQALALAADLQRAGDRVARIQAIDAEAKAVA